MRSLAHFGPLVRVVFRLHLLTRHLKYTIYYETKNNKQDKNAHTHTERRNQNNQPHTRPPLITAFIATGCSDVQFFFFDIIASVKIFYLQRTICSLSRQEKEVRGRRDGGRGFVNWCIFICSSAALSAWRSIALDAGRHGVGRGGKFLDFCKNFTRPEMWTSMRGLVTPVGATPIDSKDQFE
ncbi:hypothetical protein Tsp_00584 [Trichinella spiralis]|uniref:hypothetical protein n=1 Tax=Trichinella spiralis TaxID=6334 RepID=UPI0001EFC040|nr:hypothetical protein Tsp_00584 [Trichinella spiralis]